MKSHHFRFAVSSPIQGQCVFKDTSAHAPIMFKREIVGWSDIHSSTGRPTNKPYFCLVVKGGPIIEFTLAVKYKIFNYIGIRDSTGQEIYENDYLQDRETGQIGSIEKINKLYYFLPNNKENLSQIGRKRLTNPKSWTIVGNTIDA